jgi:hypothetical protein
MAILAILGGPPPPFFQLLLKTKLLLQIDAWVAPAWPLGGAWVAQGWPKGDPIPIPIPSRQRVAVIQELRGATTAALPTVIVSERRSREPNDLKPELRIRLIAKRQLLAAIFQRSLPITP